MKLEMIDGEYRLTSDEGLSVLFTHYSIHDLPHSCEKVLLVMMKDGVQVASVTGERAGDIYEWLSVN